MRATVFFIIIAAVALASCAHRGGSLRAVEPLAATPPNKGRAVFLKNCAHCHGVDVRGDEGPDLHNLEESDSWIANRIRNGKKGQMTAFAGKLHEEQIDAVVRYLRELK